MGRRLADGIQQGEVPHHLERNNKRYDYILGGTKLESSRLEMDFGVLVHNSLCIGLKQQKGQCGAGSQNGLH